jgi:hypothetical protein
MFLPGWISLLLHGVKSIQIFWTQKKRHLA